MEATATLSPVEVDTELARIWGEKAKAAAQLAAAIKNSTRKYCDNAYHMSRIPVLEAEIAVLSAEAAPFEADYASRPWNRYFLVQNAGGHVHRGMNCTTCFISTQYAWIIDLADCDEADMIVEYGEKACTICFPDAPANPAFHAPGRRDRATLDAKEAEKSERAAKAALKNLTTDEMFRDWNYRVTTVAAAKQALRDSAALLAGFGYDHMKAEASRINADARDALARTTSPEEIEKISTRAVARASKEWS